MAGAGAGTGGPEAPGGPGGRAPGAGPDWAGGLPADVLAKVAATVVARREAEWAAWLKEDGWDEGRIRETMMRRKPWGHCLFVFARVCKGWHKAYLKFGGRLRTRVKSDVLLPGRVALVNWALGEGCPQKLFDDTMVHHAAAFGHLELVKWLCRERGFKMDERVMSGAAGSGNLELVRWLRAAGCEWSEEACAEAAFFGRLEVLQWLQAKGCPWDAKTCANLAVEGGHVEVLRWARETGGWVWNEATCALAAVSGQLEVLKWLHGKGCPWKHGQVYSLAALNGHLEVLRWAGENSNVPWGDSEDDGRRGGREDPDGGPRRGRAGGLRRVPGARMRAPRADLDEDEVAIVAAIPAHSTLGLGLEVCLNAAAGGHLEVLQWLRANGCPWDVGTCHHAVKQGHVEVLRWARENGCPWWAVDRDRAAEKLGYTDDLGNLVE